ncbi:MAG: cytochrome c3 family protein [Pseudobdellovibrionaceae bacterium]
MRTTLKQLKILWPFAAIAATILMFQNCGVERPAVENPLYASVSFKHTGQETSCSACHELSRPTTTVGFIGLNPNAPFDYFSHASGTDCITCHNPQALSRTSADWAKGYYVHSPLLTSCVGCHSSQRPTTLVAGGFNHSTSGTGECFTCHQSALQTSFSNLSNWSGAAGTPASLVWDPAQDITLTAQIPTYADTSIISLASQTLSYHMSMNHNTTQVKATDLQNCALCHAGASSGSYLPGEFHPSLTKANLGQPTSCSDCHNSSVRPKGFVGPTNSTRIPPSPIMKHDAVVWSKNSAGNYVATTTSLMNNDCSTCHKQPGVAWTAAQYHQSLVAAGLTQPSSCLDCHANSRPKGLVPLSPPAGTTQFDHINLGGNGDCLTCHSSQTTWKGGLFHAANAKPTSCVACHETSRPTSSSGFTSLNTNTPFDFTTHGSPLDCATCHSATTQFTSKSQWSGGNFVHSSSLVSCSTCHSSQRPTTIVNGFDHSTSGTGDCIGCHGQTLTNNQFTSMANWGSALSVPSGYVGAGSLSVTSTHLNYSGTRVISTLVQTQSLPKQMLHSSSQVPASISTNCAACHSQASSGIYAGGKFHASLTTLKLAQPTSCRDCHAGTLPVDIVGTTLTPMDHAALLSGGGSAASNFDCATCHAQPGVTFGDGKFHFKISTKFPTNCTTCHYPVMPQTALNQMTHTSDFAVQDCMSCHSLPSSTQASSPASTNWAGGVYHGRISPSPTACVDCHTGQKPGGVTVSAVDSQHMSHMSANLGTECAACHLNDQNSSPRAWQKNASFHAVVTPLTCQDCHGLTNGGGSTAGTNNDLPAGLTFSNTLTTSSVAPANTFDQITHKDVNAAGKDCIVCHTQVGPGGTKWKSAQFHSRITTLTLNGTTGRCDNCHMNIKPTVVVSGMDHSTIGTQDCSACHTYPGTGTQGAGNWKGAAGGGAHTASFITSNANTCINCHTSGGSTTPPLGSPATVINSGQTGLYSKTITFAHGFTSTSAGSTGTSTVTYQMSICLACHTAAATKAMANNGAGYLNSTAWAGTGTFNHQIASSVTFNGTSTTVTASAPMQSCLPCHANEALSGTHHNLNCTAPKSPTDCVQCHTTGGSWNISKGGGPVCK